MTGVVPDHGSPKRYRHGCRCIPCKTAVRREAKQRELNILSGRPCRIPAGPVVAHVRALHEGGMTGRQIARLAGGDPVTVRSLLKGQKTVSPKTAYRFLSVPFDIRADRREVPAVGAARRVQALYCLGFSNQQLAEETGVPRKTLWRLVTGRHLSLTLTADDQIRAAYDRLSMSKGDSARSFEWAERNGWVPPLAWDDDVIDDPSAVPQVDAIPPVYTDGDNVVDRWLMGESVILDREGRRDAINHLMEWTNLTPQEIADRLDMNAEAVSRSWERSKNKARDEGRRLWRRAYIPRERDLTKNQMEEAA